MKLLAKACDAGDEATCERANNAEGHGRVEGGSGETVSKSTTSPSGHVKWGPDAIENPCATGLRVGADATCVKLDAGGKFVCDPSDFDECKRLCEAGDGKNCYNAAANRVGKWNTASKTGQEDAYGYLEKSCKAGYAPGCGEARPCARMLGKGVKANRERAVGFFDKACTGGDQPSCKFLATNYLCAFPTCNGLKKNAAKAIAYYKKGCDLGDVGACKDGGAALEHGTNGVKKNPKAAGALYEKACKLGETTICDRAKQLKSGKTK